LKGLVLAALAAAIVSSLASMLNSTATIFTMDLYKPFINRNATDRQTVAVGRITAAVALLIAVMMAPLLGSIPQAFQFIQEYTGIVSPGILAIFMLGLFWKKTTNNAAIWGAVLSIPFAMYFKAGSKGWFESTALEGLFPTLAWMDQMGLTFLLVTFTMVVISFIEKRGGVDEKGIPLNRTLFATTAKFNISAFVICLILAALYAIFW
jgi:SSS family solute:Na+ symporter